MMALAGWVRPGTRAIAADERLDVVDDRAGTGEDLAVGRQAQLDAVLVGAVAAHDGIDEQVAAGGDLVGAQAKLTSTSVALAC